MGFGVLRIKMFSRTLTSTILANSTAHLHAHGSVMYLMVIPIIKMEGVPCHKTSECSLE